MNIHILPIDDTHKHNEEGMACLCNPKIEKQENGDMLVIHNAYDMREIKEKHLSVN